MKASGMGLNMPPASFNIGVDRDRLTPAGWQSVRAPGAAGQDRYFRLTRLEVRPGYSAAVALEFPPSVPFQAPRLRYFDYEPVSRSKPARNPAVNPAISRQPARPATTMEETHDYLV
jgi:hypothetical protein